MSKSNGIRFSLYSEPRLSFQTLLGLKVTSEINCTAIIGKMLAPKNNGTAQIARNATEIVVCLFVRLSSKMAVFIDNTASQQRTLRDAGEY